MERLYHLRLIVFILCALLTITSCGDDDDDDNANNELVGRWESTSFSLTNCASGDPDLIDFGCGSCFINTFNNDNTFRSTVFVPALVDSSVVGTYTVSGNTLTTCDQNGNFCESSTFTLVDGVLVVSSDDLGCSIEIDFEAG